MTDYLDELEELLGGCHRYDDYLAALCPFHEDSRPSFIVHADSYKCLSCDAHGSTKSLFEKLSNSVPVHTEVKDFRNPFTWWLKKDEYIEKVLIKAWQILTTNPWQGSYLHQRGINAEMCKRYGVGYRENWFTFPLKNKSNTVVGAVARAGHDNDSPSKYVVPAHQNPNLLYIPSLSLIENSDKIYITFGIIDALSLVICGIASASTTNGKRISPSSLREFEKKIIIIPDRGEEAAAYNLASNLGWRGKVLKVKYPEGLKDCNDVLKIHGPTALKSLLE